MVKAKPSSINPKKLLERLRSNESVAALATELGMRDGEVKVARELVRHIGEHQASAAGKLPDALAQAVVEAAVQIEHAGFLKKVAEEGSKAAAGAAKRGLAILRSKGIEVELAPAGEPIFKPEIATEAELPCFLTTPDSGGERALWIPRPLRGGLELVTVLFSDAQGILHVEVGDTSRKAFRKLRDDLRSRALPHGVSFLEITLKRAKGYLAAARALAPKGLRVEHETHLTGLIGDPRDAESPARTEPAASPELESQWVSESAQLHGEREVGSWVPEPNIVRSLGLKLEEVMTSRLYLDEKQRGAQAEQEVSKATEAYFTPECRSRYASRLFELVEVFRAEGRDEAGRRAAATARALLGGTETAAIPFCRRMFEKLLAEPPSKGEGEQEAEPEEPHASPLIVPGSSAP
jgi:hypothetical protein